LPRGIGCEGTGTADNLETRGGSWDSVESLAGKAIQTLGHCWTCRKVGDELARAPSGAGIVVKTGQKEENNAERKALRWLQKMPKVAHVAEVVKLIAVAILMYSCGPNQAPGSPGAEKGDDWYTFQNDGFASISKNLQHPQVAPYHGGRSTMTRAGKESSHRTVNFAIRNSTISTIDLCCPRTTLTCRTLFRQLKESSFWTLVEAKYAPTLRQKAFELKGDSSHCCTLPVGR